MRRKILIEDDSLTDRQKLESIVSAAGHQALPQEQIPAHFNA